MSVTERRDYQLFLRHLTCQERDSWEKAGRFEFESQWGRKFIMFNTRTERRCVLEYVGERTHYHCVLALGVPYYDSLLATLLAIKYNELYFRDKTREGEMEEGSLAGVYYEITLPSVM